MYFVYLITLAAIALGSPLNSNWTLDRRAYLPEPIDAVKARQYLDELIVASPVTNVPFDRKKFQHWIGIDGKCDTRGTILKRDAIGEVTMDSECRVISGSWRSDYDGMLITNTHSRGLDIGHVVPLKEAWQTGAYNWTSERRREFANDLTRPQVLSVSAHSNRMKGHKNPSKWMPSFREFRCPYVRAWIQVKHHYSLTVDRSEKNALVKLIKDC